MSRKAEAETDAEVDAALETKVSDVAALVLAMEPVLRGSTLDTVTSALATLLASAFGQRAATAAEHQAMCDWLTNGLLEDRRTRFGPQAMSTRVQ